MSKYSLYNLMIEDIRKAYNVYVDMDGVLTDFERRFEQFAGITPDEFMSQKTIEFGDAKANEQFWDLVDKQIGVRFWFPPFLRRMLIFPPKFYQMHRAW